MTKERRRKDVHQLIEDLSEPARLAEAKKLLRGVRVACAMREAQEARRALGDVLDGLPLESKTSQFLAKMKREAGR
jgi:hypothetical protein